jgi:threonine/homoserine/homoserine lactone efflux protein
VDPQLWAFGLVATLLAVTPGADTPLVVRDVLTRGRRAGLATTAGIAAGCLVHATLSAVGVSLILARPAEAFAPLKWGGAAYLVVLGGNRSGAGSGRPWPRPRMRTRLPADNRAVRDACARSSRACSPTC